ncbi:hypothetical protein [Sinomicrobium sp. M5D2P9]
MNRLVFIPFIVLLLSCSNNDDDSPVDPVDPVDNNNFVFDSTYEITEAKHFAGPEGEEVEGDGTAFLKKEWSFYKDPGVLEINFKEDSIQIRTEPAVYAYRYEVEKNDVFIYQGDKKILIGQVQNGNKELYLYKKYLAYLIVTDKDNNEVVYEKSNDFGIITEEDIFPVIVGSPSDLIQEEEYIFWGTIRYKFIPEQ